MSTPAYGENCTLSIKVADVYYPILCGTDLSYTRTPEFIEKTGPTSGFSREYVVRIEDWAASVSGLTMIENGSTISFFYILQEAVRRAVQDIKLHFEDQDGNYKEITGQALIGTMNISGPVTNFSNATIELRGTGDFEMDVIPPPAAAVENYIDIPIVEDEISVQDNVLIGKTVLQVRRNGGSLTMTTGTPGNLEYKFDTATGEVFTDVNVPYVAGEQPIYVLYR